MNIRDNPEKFGLEIVYEIDAADCYEFDLLVIWRNPATKQLYLGTDSGCSCPIPFEGDGIMDLEPATPEAVREWFESKMRRGYGREIPAGSLESALSVFEVTKAG